MRTEITSPASTTLPEQTRNARKTVDAIFAKAASLVTAVSVAAAGAARLATQDKTLLKSVEQMEA